MTPELKGTSILVTGGAGFVGSNLIKRLLRDGCGKVVIIDNLLSADIRNIPVDSRVEFIQSSIASADLLNSLPDAFDFVFHLSTFHGNESSIARPLQDFENNLATTIYLYQKLSGFKRIKRLVYTSTGCALSAKGVTDFPVPVVEDGNIPLDFDSPYQISKVVGEMYGLYFHRTTNLPVTRARFQNVYGPGEILGAGEWRGTPATVWRNVLPTFVYRALHGMPLLIHGDGSSSRDFIYVDDIVEGLIRCAITPGVEGDVFNLASGTAVLISELARKIVKLTGGKSAIELIPARTWDRSIQRVGSTDKSIQHLGFAARVPFEKGLEQTVAWTRANLALIDDCIAKHRKQIGLDVS